MFGSEIKWMKNFGEKIGEKTFLGVFGWVRREKNKWWGPSIFSLGSPKYFLSKIERKLSENEFFLN